ncbi:MAG: hypothetical protein PPP55_07290 [Halorubrum sp.]
MNLGVFDMIGLAASLVFAIPLANYAVMQLFAGQTALGAGLLVVAVAMVVLPQYFLDPGRILAGLLRGLLPKQLRGDADATDTRPKEAESSTSGGESSIPNPEGAAGSADTTTAERDETDSVTR